MFARIRGKLKRSGGMLWKRWNLYHRKPSIFCAAAYRIPLPVTEIVRFRSGDSYTVCPRCDSLLDREYMGYCDSCGQRLAWELLRCAKVVYAPRKK